MIITATLSKPTNQVEKQFERNYKKIKLAAKDTVNGLSYFVEFFTETQVFHKIYSVQEAENFVEQNAGITFKNCVIRTENQEITILANKKGKITRLEKNTAIKLVQRKENNKKKNYILSEGVPIPFLVLLGIMTDEGKIIASKYDKFKQINRFLEFVDDILPDLMEKKGSDDILQVVDFGCGKSYLTFAVQYYLTEIKKINCRIEGLDLKQDVIKYCNEIVVKLNLKNLSFRVGNISDYSGELPPDLIITLHACDTATDFALEYGVRMGAKGILSVPCCQHQINQQLSLSASIKNASSDFMPLLKWGIIREKFSSLVTDALRGEWLEQQGYNVQMLEFIDIEHTPKNILIRAIKNPKKNILFDTQKPLMDALKIQQELWKNT